MKKFLKIHREGHAIDTCLTLTEHTVFKTFGKDSHYNGLPCSSNRVHLDGKIYRSLPEI